MTRFSFHTELGMRENLEDSGQALIIRSLKSQAGEVAIFMVFDGVGGQDCGEIASQLAASQVTQSLCLFFSTWSADPLGPELPIDTITKALVRALERANQAIIQLCNEASETKAMATTAVCGVVVDSTLYVAWAGDSRCYLDQQNQFQCLTRDHSEAQRLVELGLLSCQGAKDHPSAHTVTRYLGQTVGFAAETAAWRINSGDVVLLCSDGLTDVICDGQIAEHIRSYQAGDFSFDVLPKRLIEDALAAGTQDNVTVLCCEYQSPESEANKITNRTLTGVHPLELANVLQHVSKENENV